MLPIMFSDVVVVGDIGVAPDVAGDVDVCGVAHGVVHGVAHETAEIGPTQMCDNTHNLH